MQARNQATPKETENMIYIQEQNKQQHKLMESTMYGSQMNMPKDPKLLTKSTINHMMGAQQPAMQQNPMGYVSDYYKNKGHPEPSPYSPN